MRDGRTGVALVTGGTGAIGSAVCRLLVRSGYDLAFTFHSNQQAADNLVKEFVAAGSTVYARRVDLVDVAAAGEFVAEVADRFGRIDVLVHAGGPHVPQVYVSQIEPARFAHHVDNELKAFFNVVSPSLLHLRRTRGCVVAVTTVALRRFPVRDALSSGAKGGVEALVRAVAAEEGRYGVRANAVGPGLLEEGMALELHANGDISEEARAATEQRIPLRRFGTAAEVAELVCFLASDRARYVTGQSVDVDGGYAL